MGRSTFFRVDWYMASVSEKVKFIVSIKVLFLVYLGVIHALVWAKNTLWAHPYLSVMDVQLLEPIVVQQWPGIILVQKIT
jgi:hypothetical protein